MYEYTELNIYETHKFLNVILKNMYIYIDLQLAHNREWGFHNARVNSVAWSPNSDMVASGSLDTTIIIWSVTNPAKHTIIKSEYRKIVYADERRDKNK